MATTIQPIIEQQKKSATEDNKPTISMQTENKSENTVAEEVESSHHTTSSNDSVGSKILVELKSHSELLNKMVKAISESSQTKEEKVETFAETKKQTDFLEIIAKSLKDIDENFDKINPKESGEKQAESSGGFDIGVVRVLGALGQALAMSIGLVIAEFQAKIEILKMIGKAITPEKLITKLTSSVEALEKGISGVVNKASSIVEKTATKAGEVAASIFSSVKTAFSSEGIIGKAAGKTIGFIEGIFANFTKPFKILLDYTSKLNASSLFEPLTKVFSAISGKVGGVAKYFENTFELFAKPFKELYEYISKFNISEIFAPIKKMFSAIGEMAGVSSVADDIAKYASKFMQSVSKFAGIFKKFLLPLNIILAVYDTVKGAIAGFEKDGIVGAIGGAIKGLFNSVIGGLLDMVKSAISWIAGKLGFENVEKILDSFSFEEEFGKIVDSIVGAIKGIVDFIKDGFGKLVNSVVQPVKKFFETGLDGDIIGALSEIPKLISAIPLTLVDLSKSAISWVASKLGFDNVKKMLDSFSFNDLYSDYIDKIVGLIKTPIKYFSTLLNDLGSKFKENIVDPLNKAFEPITNFFKNLKEQIVSVFEGLEIPAVSFNVPGLGKVTFGPWHPFKSDDEVKKTSESQTTKKTDSVDTPVAEAAKTDKSIPEQNKPSSDVVKPQSENKESATKPNVESQPNVVLPELVKPPVKPEDGILPNPEKVIPEKVVTPIKEQSENKPVYDVVAPEKLDKVIPDKQIVINTVDDGKSNAAGVADAKSLIRDAAAGAKKVTQSDAEVVRAKSFENSVTSVHKPSSQAPVVVNAPTTISNNSTTNSVIRIPSRNNDTTLTSYYMSRYNHA